MRGSDLRRADSSSRSRHAAGLEGPAGARGAGAHPSSPGDLRRSRPCASRAGRQQVLRLVEGLEELDDVQHVYANFDIPDEVLEAQGVA
jgi:hypothetical protein